jgi:hypothetical protein
MNGSEINLTWKEWRELYWAETTTSEYADALAEFHDLFGDWPSRLLS